MRIFEFFHLFLQCGLFGPGTHFRYFVIGDSTSQFIKFDRLHELFLQCFLGNCATLLEYQLSEFFISSIP